MAPAPTTTLDRDTPAGVLGALARTREVIRRGEIEMMQAALEWAAMHSADSLDQAMTVPGTDRTLAIAGQGAPLVAEFAVVELAAALGRSADSAKLWLGTVLEIRHRLPRVWSRVVHGPLEPWRARQIANATLGLCWDAAGWVDQQVAPIAHKIGPAQLERVVADAVRRFDPEQAYENELANAESRHVTIHDRHTVDGLVEVTATLDAIDARDLDVAVGQAAHSLLVAGCAESLDVRRALALGEIARHELTLDITTSEPSQTASGCGKDATLYVHVHADDLDLLDDQTGADQPTALIEQTGAARDYPIGIDHLKQWLTRPGTTVTIRPVIDLAASLEARGYHPSPTLREQVILRNRTCVFPHCTRSVRSADLDHIQAYERGGRTSSENLAPLCRLHHRAKTHDLWTYTHLAPGEFLWRSPHGHTFHVDPTGTTSLGPPRHTPRP